ncbi:unnamed protein product [Rhizoctonia solani]|uniref:alcohol dehydrogenase n=1 Tax=Rhizoctonia solani TaxID=456999 RepID=A0A8H3DK40_9AGAM|nr:unnamed protein product [Rhizoctonia solani]
MASSHPTTDLTVPLTQKAAIVERSGGPVRIVERRVAQPSELKSGEILVKLLYSGVCHTDVHIAQGALGEPPIQPLIGGHEGTGVIVAIGDGTTTQFKVGQAVGINWPAKTCLSCEAHATHVTPIPESLPLHSAAPILCAGLSVYGALKESNTEPGDIIVITGAGGGLGHLAIQYAINVFDLRVIAVDTGDNKRELCLKLGAEAFVDFKASRTSQNVIEEVKKAADGAGAHAVLVTSSAANSYEGVVDYLRPRGTLLALGASLGCMINIDIITVMSRCITIKGMVTGNRDIMRQALDIAARGRVNTICRIEPLAKLPEVFEELQAGKLAGRVVLDLWK